MALQREIARTYGGLKAESFYRCRAVGSGHSPDGDRRGSKCGRQRSLKIPHFTRDTAKQVKTKRPEFRERVTGEMRFCQQTKTGYTAGVRKLVPLRLSNWPEPQPGNNSLKEPTQKLKVSKRLSRTSVYINHPFDSIHNLARSYC